MMSMMSPSPHLTHRHAFLLPLLLLLLLPLASAVTRYGSRDRSVLAKVCFSMGYYSGGTVDCLLQDSATFLYSKADGDVLCPGTRPDTSSSSSTSLRIIFALC